MTHFYKHATPPESKNKQQFLRDWTSVEKKENEDDPVVENPDSSGGSNDCRRNVLKMDSGLRRNDR